MWYLFLFYILSLVALKITEFHLSLKGLNERKQRKWIGPSREEDITAYSLYDRSGQLCRVPREEELRGSRMEASCFFMGSWGHASHFWSWVRTALEVPLRLAVDLQGSAICCRSPCCITRRQRFRVDVGVFWPSVQLTSFRKRANSFGYRPATGVPVDTPSWNAQATWGEKGPCGQTGLIFQFVFSTKDCFPGWPHLWWKHIEKGGFICLESW